MSYIYCSGHGSDEVAELPVWNRRLSFRGQPYRCAHHQNGVMGHFQVSTYVRSVAVVVVGVVGGGVVIAAVVLTLKKRHFHLTTSSKRS